MKWNIIDRLSTQILYAVTGIVLAREISQEEFGLVGALLVFQAFASLLIDSGFSYALLQCKRPTRLDYSTVLWFNLIISTLLYTILFITAPLIADCFQGDMRLVPLARVMFLCLIFNSAGIVQTNRMMKAMDVRMVAASNALGLIIGSVIGIWLAVTGYGAWAIVWQSVIIAAVKSIVLWTSSGWRPLWRFSWKSLQSFAGLGSKMLFSSFLNTLFQKVYALVIGNRVSLTALGYYTQSDKWSTMGVASLSQIFTSSFVPPLSAVQDNNVLFTAMVSKINRFTAYILFPMMFGLMAMATPVFHTLFGLKWDPSIILFQILILRGVFTVLNSLYSNYLLALGHGSAIMKLEIVRDTAAIIALAVTFPFMNISTPGQPVLGIEILLYGQLAASFITWIASLATTIRLTGVGLRQFITDMTPYIAQTILIIPVMLYAGSMCDASWLKLCVEITVALGLYMGGNHIFHSKVQTDVIAFISGRKKNVL